MLAEAVSQELNAIFREVGAAHRSDLLRRLEGIAGVQCGHMESARSADIRQETAAPAALQSLREASGLKKMDFVRRTGLRWPAVTKLEQSDVPPHVETVRKYLSALGAQLVMVAAYEDRPDVVIGPPASYPGPAAVQLSMRFRRALSALSPGARRDVVSFCIDRLENPAFRIPAPDGKNGQGFAVLAVKPPQALRREAGLTQDEMVAKGLLGQSSIEGIETGRRGKKAVATYAKYVAATGGRLRLFAAFPGRPPIALKGIAGLEAGPRKAPPEEGPVPFPASWRRLEKKFAAADPAVRDATMAEALRMIADKSRIALLHRARAGEGSTTLAALRKKLGVSQGGLARQSGLARLEIARSERDDGPQFLSSIDRYVTALGGRLKAVVEFGDDKPVTLTGLPLPYSEAAERRLDVRPAAASPLDPGDMAEQARRLAALPERAQEEIFLWLRRAANDKRKIDELARRRPPEASGGVSPATASLGELRGTFNLSYGEIHRRTGLSKSTVNRIDRGIVSDIGVYTLSSYVRGLGGRLRLMASFRDEASVYLAGLTGLAEELTGLAAGRGTVRQLGACPLSSSPITPGSRPST